MQMAKVNGPILMWDYFPLLQLLVSWIGDICKFILWWLTAAYPSLRRKFSISGFQVNVVSKRNVYVPILEKLIPNVYLCRLSLFWKYRFAQKQLDIVYFRGHLTVTNNLNTSDVLDYFLVCYNGFLNKERIITFQGVPVSVREIHEFFLHFLVCNLGFTFL